MNWWVLFSISPKWRMSPTNKLGIDFSCHSAIWWGSCDSLWTHTVLLSAPIWRHVSPAGAFPTCHMRLSAIVTFNYSFSACHHEGASTGAKEVTSSLCWLADLAQSREQVLQPEMKSWANLTGITSTVL